MTPPPNKKQYTIFKEWVKLASESDFTFDKGGHSDYNPVHITSLTRKFNTSRSIIIYSLNRCMYWELFQAHDYYY